MINLLDNKIYQTLKCRTQNQVEINNSVSGTYNTNNQITFKTVTLKSILYDYRDAYTVVNGTITTDGAAADSQNKNNKI